VLVLASASPRRRGLLSAAGYSFVVRPSDVDETPPPGADGPEAAVDIARRKALAAARTCDDVVLAADTIVVAADGEFLGKPRDAADAKRILAKLSGTTHRVVTGVCVASRRGASIAVASETTLVTMRRLADREIDAYVATGEGFDKAGGYAIQETADRFVVAIEGSRTNVVGLPIETAGRLLRDAGVVAGEPA